MDNGERTEYVENNGDTGSGIPESDSATQTAGDFVDPANGTNGTSNLHGYKVVCAKLGFSMIVYFLCRLLAGWTTVQLFRFSDTLGETAYNIISSAMIVTLVYIIPVVVTALIFKSFSGYKGKYKQLYQRPKRLARALGTFPASFGLGHGVALLTLLAAYLISRFAGGQTYIEDLLRPTVVEPTTNIAGVFGLIFLLVVIAPVFEEYWVRGIMYDALKPYGAGMAIIISSLLFGLMHGSLYMLFYTTAYGFALGYIRYATGSLFTVTILHAIVNSIAAITLLLTTLMEITNEANRALNTIYTIYLMAVLIMIIVGIAVFLSKIPKIRKYKIENKWTEIGPWKKIAVFFVSIPVILMMVLAFNEISGGLLMGLLR